MKISRNWLQSYIDLTGIADEEISRAVTFLGFEVEQVIHSGAPALGNVFVGEVLSRERHPNADKLSICNVDVGPVRGVKRIVCGAQNYRVGDRVPVALVGAVLPGDFVIKESRIRGEASSGMMCSAKELTISEEGAGLLILSGRPEPGSPINAVLPPGDVVFDVEITPNRPDCQSHIGLARELAAWFRKALTYPEVRFTPAAANPQPRPDLLSSVRVDAPEDCPLYTATVITGVKIGPSPDWMRQRLSAVGLRPINNVVDIGNYVMLEYGQPVHAFDAKKLGGAQIVVRRASETEKIVTLDEKERTLSSDLLVIADASRPVVVAGIMGGVNSGVDDSTTDLVLEVAYFTRGSVRSASRRLGLASDSSYRFERGVDVHSLEEAMHRCIDLLLEFAGGNVAGPTIRVGTDVPWQREVTITPAYVNEKLGFEIPAPDMKAALEALELTIVREEPTLERGTAWTVEIPSWRDDLDRPIDLVEEILRLHGTDKIPAALVQAPGLVGDDDPIVRFNRRVTDLMMGRSFVECVNYTLRSAKELAAWTVPETLNDFALSNPFVEDQSHLRSTLVSGLLESLRLNQDRGVEASRLFETGRVFLHRKGLPSECVAAGFIELAGTDARAWRRREPADFYTAKRTTEVLAEAAGIDLGRQPVTLVSAPGFGWQAGHAAQMGNIDHGWAAAFGLIDLAVLKSLGIQGEVFAGFFAIAPDKLASAGVRRRYQPFSLFPAALRDLALVVPWDVSAGEVQKALAKVGRAAVGTAFVLEDITVFDVYHGKGLPAGTKSLAFGLVFRSPERTLTDNEVNATFVRIQEEVVKTTSYQIRK